MRSRGRKVLHGLIPGYHGPMMNDARRNTAWDRALRRAVRPGMHVFEIGTGAGMLAMMAARAGAERVTTCEGDPVLAMLARELARQNGLADRIDVVTRHSGEIAIGTDMPRRADLLFCDIFADDLVGFDPLAAIADAKARLMAPDAPTIPAAASLQVALAHWDDYERECLLESACGFDLSPMKEFAPIKNRISVGVAGLRIVSDTQQALRFDFSLPDHARAGSVDVAAEAVGDCVANGLVRWIRLELDDETILEARPEPGGRFFSAPVFCPFAEPRSLRAGDKVTIRILYEGTRIESFVLR